MTWSGLRGAVGLAWRFGAARKRPLSLSPLDSRTAMMTSESFQPTSIGPVMPQGLSESGFVWR